MGKALNMGRWTTEIPAEGAVVFLIGMRINRLRDVTKWVPVTAAMPRMLAELAKQPELGLLSARSYISGRDFLVVQYWRSIEDLQRYAQARDHEHLPAWRRFNAKVAKTKSVGIWHETYPISPGKFEGIYANMPAFGMAGALGTVVPVGSGRQSAASRLNPSTADAPIVEPPIYSE